MQTRNVVLRVLGVFAVAFLETVEIGKFEEQAALSIQVIAMPVHKLRSVPGCRSA